MRVRAKDLHGAVPPPAIQPYVGQVLVTAGVEYEVNAVSTFEGVVSFQVVDDAGFPNWSVAWLFDVVDSTMPLDWVCSSFADEPSLVIGPPFLASGLDAYQAMVEMEPVQVRRFWRRYDERHKYEPARYGAKMPDRLGSEDLAALLVDALLRAGLVADEAVGRAVNVAAGVFEARKAIGDY